MITLVETEQPQSTLGPMFGQPRDQLWWHHDAQSWEVQPPPSRPAVECQIFPRQQVCKDWLADWDGKSTEMNQAERKTLASAWLTSATRGEEILSTPRLLQRAKEKGDIGIMALDLATGWEFQHRDDQQEALRLLAQHKPAIVALTLAQVPEMAHKAQHFTLDLAKQQLKQGRGFLLESPLEAKFCRSPELQELQEHKLVFSVSIDFKHLGVGDGKCGIVACPVVALTNVPELFRTVRRRLGHMASQPVHAADTEPTKLRSYVSAFSSLLNQGLRRHLRTQHVSMTHARERWAWQGYQLVCRHFFPRQHLCLPEECPFDVSHIKFTGLRTTRMDPVGGQTKVVEDDWPTQLSRTTSISWTGTTIFHTVPDIMLPEALAQTATKLAKCAAHDFHQFQAEQHALQAELSLFPSHRVLEGRQASTTSASASARPSADVHRLRASASATTVCR